jgi:hypothetical protein
MDASQWPTILGVAVGILGFVVTALSVNHIIRTSNEAPERSKTELTNAIRQVLREEKDYQTAARRIDDIERRYAVVAKGTAYIDLRRLAARKAFVAATDKGASFEDISARYQRMCDLGFYSIPSELATLVEFAYACLESGHREEGLHVLLQARERLQAAPIDSQSRLSVLIERCGQLLESGDAI